MIVLRLLRDGAVVRETVFTQLPVTIGRGAESDFIVPDVSVSRRHAVLTRSDEGPLVLKDLGSVNGVHVGPARQELVTVGSHIRCRLGRVEIEVEPVSPEATQEIRVEDWGRFEQRRAIGHHIRYVAFGVLGWVVLQLISPAFWSPWQKNREAMLLGGAVGVLVALPIISFLLFGALKLAGRRVRVADTLQATARLTWISPAIVALSSVAYYVSSASAHGALGQVVAWVSAVASITYLAALRRPAPRKAFAVGWAAALTVIWIGIQMSSSLESRRLGQPQNDYEILPPIAGVSGVTKDLDAYLGEARALAESTGRTAEDVRVRQEGR
jgi:hypothetical protein